MNRTRLFNLVRKFEEDRLNPPFVYESDDNTIRRIWEAYLHREFTIENRSEGFWEWTRRVGVKDLEKHFNSHEIMELLMYEE